MNQINCPAILVECGFMSNDAEVKQLQEANYQKKIVSIIASGVLSITQKEGESKLV